MSKQEIDDLYDYMLHDLKIPNDNELEKIADSFQDLLTKEQYYELELHINMLISIAERQGLRRALQMIETLIK